MRARKAYISSLGTTGVLVALPLLMLAVVGALLAFDRWPNQAVAEPVTVQIAAQSPDAIGRSVAEGVMGAPRDAVARGGVSAGRGTALPGVAARAGRVQGRAGAARTAQAEVSEPIVSELPAPDTAPESTAPAQGGAATTAPADGPGSVDPAGGRAPNLTLPTTAEPAEGGHLADVTDGLGDTIGGLSPALGVAVRSTGATADDSVDGLIGARDG